MGSSFSSASVAAAASTADRLPTAKVIGADGSLIDYSQRVKVSQVLGVNHRAFFLCNADELFYGHEIQALEDSHLIEPEKLYFVLPAKRLNQPLTAAEMAALAGRATSAFADADLKRKKSGGNGRRRRKAVRVTPVITAMESDWYERFNESSVGSRKMESGGREVEEVKQRALRRGKGAVKGPFRPWLSPIEEVYE